MTQHPEWDLRWDRYWWCCGADGWWIETWDGPATPENVVRVGQAADLESAEALVSALNVALTSPPPGSGGGGPSPESSDTPPENPSP